MDIHEIAQTVEKNIQDGKLVFSNQTVGVPYIMKLFDCHVQNTGSFVLYDVEHHIEENVFSLSGHGTFPDGDAFELDMEFRETEEEILQVWMAEQYAVDMPGLALSCTGLYLTDRWRISFQAEKPSISVLIADGLHILGLTIPAEVFGDLGEVSLLRFRLDLPFEVTAMPKVYSLQKDNFINVRRENYFSLYFETDLMMDLSDIFSDGEKTSLEITSFSMEKFAEVYDFRLRGQITIWGMAIPFSIRYGQETLQLAIVREKQSVLKIPSVNDLGKIVGIDSLNLPENLSALSEFELENLTLSVSQDFKQLLSFSAVVSNRHEWQISQTPDICITNLKAGFTTNTESNRFFIGGDFKLDNWTTTLSSAYQTDRGWIFYCCLGNDEEQALDLCDLFQKLCRFLGFEEIPFPLPSIRFISAMVSFDMAKKVFAAQMEIEQICCDFSFSFVPNMSMHLELEAGYEFSLAELPVVGKDLHLLDGVTIRNIRIVSDSDSTTLSLEVAGQQLRMELSDDQKSEGPTCYQIHQKIYAGYDAGAGKMKLLWFRMEKSFSVLTIHRLGVGFDGEGLTLALDAEFSSPAFQFALDGLGITIPIQRRSVPDFMLSGLSVGYQQPGFALSGGFTHVVEETGDSYAGAITTTAGELTMEAVGIYAEGSFLAYGIIRARIGGPPAFSITGLALGFGLNEYLRLPDIQEVESYPLVAAAIDPSYTADRLIDGIKREASIMPGQNFLAAGVCFHSFGMAVSTALLTVSFGSHLEVGVLGTSVMTAPPMTKKDPIARAQMALRAVYLPEQGVFSAEAQLTDDSYVLSRNCHLTGGFAFYLWFDGEHKDDFVITLGGYSPKYPKPEHYPDVPRLGFLWRVTSSLVLSGEMYCALTPSALYAGGKLEAVFTQGALRAWFTAYTDIAIGWKPFFYDFSVGVSLGASITLDFWLFSTTFTLEMSVDLRIRGPEFSGTARVSWWVISFTISFGGSEEKNASISWQEFKESFLEAPEKENTAGEILSISTLKGGSGSSSVQEDGEEKTLEIIQADQTVLMVSSQIPVTEMTLNGAVSHDSQGFGVPPMGNVTMESSVSITVALDPGNGEHPVEIVAEQIHRNMPKALWGGNGNQTEGELLPECLIGVSIQFVPKEWVPFPKNSFLTLDRLEEYEKVKKAFSFSLPSTAQIEGRDEGFSVFRETAKEIPEKVGNFAREMEKARFCFDFTPDLTMMAEHADSLFEEEFLIGGGWQKGKEDGCGSLCICANRK